MEKEKTMLIYSVVRYGQVIGHFRNIEDALQVQKVSIEKGQICDLIVKPLN